MELLWQLIILDVIDPCIRTPKDITGILKSNYKINIEASELYVILNKMVSDNLLKKHNYHPDKYLEEHHFELTTLGYNIVNSINEKYRYHTKLSDFLNSNTK